MITVTEEEVQIHCLPGQLEILALPDPHGYYIGGYGCGKTDGLAMFLDDECHRYKNNYVCAAAATYTQLERSTIKKTKEYLDRRGIPYKHNKNEKSIKYLDGCESEIVFQTCDIAPELLQGPEYGALAIEEAESVSFAHVKKLRGRVRKPMTSRKKRYFSNPPPENSWLMDAYEKGRDFFYLADTRENITLPQDYIDDLLEMYPPGSYGYRRYIVGEMGVPLEGAVYPEFSSKIHLIDEQQVPWDRIVGYVNGLDFGHSVPTAFLVGALDDDDNLYIIDEHYAAKLLFSDHADNIRAVYQGGPIIRDHDPQAAAELEELRISTLPARKEVHLGINAVRSRLVRKKLFIVRGAAPNLVGEFGSYIWKPKGDAPMKLNDHAMDALRYMCVALDHASEDDELTYGIYGV